MNLAMRVACVFGALVIGLLPLVGLPDSTRAAFQAGQLGETCLEMRGSDVPVGLFLIEQGARSDVQIASGFPDPDEALLLLRAWGFMLNNYWNYASVAGFSTANGTNSLEVSIHLFSSPASAAAALPYYAKGRATMLGLGPILFQEVGDLSSAIGGYRDVGYEVTLYIQMGPALIRISGVAPYGNPTPDVAYAALRVLCGLVLGI